MSGPLIQFGTTSPPKVSRNTVTGAEEIVAVLKEQPGVWAQVSIPDVSVGRLMAALAIQGCVTATRKNGTELHAKWGEVVEIPDDEEAK